jgi:hypothetical protein
VLAGDAAAGRVAAVATERRMTVSVWHAGAEAPLWSGDQRGLYAKYAERREESMAAIAAAVRRHAAAAAAGAAASTLK